MRTEHGPRRGRRGLLAAVGAVLAALALVLAPTLFDGAHASFAATTSNGTVAWRSDQLQPASGLTVSQSCTPGSSAVSQRASTTAIGTAQVVLPMPTGTTAGDYLLAHVAYHDSAQTLSAPSGWELVGRTDNSTVASNVYWKVATTNEPDAVFRHPTTGSSALFAGGVTAFRNVRAVAPLLGGASGSSTTATTPSVTSPYTGGHLVHLFSKTQGPLNDVADITDLYADETGTGSGIHVGIRGAGEAFTNPGSTPSRNATAGTDSRWVAQVVVLQRAGTPTANLSWTPSPSTWADGYALERASGGSTTPSTVSGAATASATQGPLVNSTPYTFTLTATRNLWRSTSVSTSYTFTC